MKKFIALLIVVAFLFPSNADARGLLGVLRAYHEGKMTRQQEDINDQTLILMQEEKTRMKAEREYLEALKKQIDQQQAKQTGQELSEKDKKAALLAAFEKNVKPRILRAHPDFDVIMQDKAYWMWAESQSPELKRCAMDSGDASDIIWAISEYKKSVTGKVVTLTPIDENGQ